MENSCLPKRYIFARQAIRFFTLIAFIVLTFFIYRSEIFFSGFYRNHYLIYYIISFCGLLFWLGLLLKSSDEFKLCTVIMFISCMIGFYIIEIGIFVISSNKNILQKEDNNITFDSRSIHEVVSDYKQNDIDAVPVVYPHGNILRKGIGKESTESLFPLGGISNKLTVVCNEGGEYFIYQSDRYGFNNPGSVWDKNKDNEKTEWILIGDSFAHGACVKPDENIAAHIRSNTNFSVINLGFGANGPLLELATLKEYASPRKPKILLWFYYEGNDLSYNLPTMRSSTLLMKYLQKDFSQELMTKQSIIDSALIDLVSNSEPDALSNALDIIIQLLKLSNVRSKLNFNKNDVIVDPLFTNILREARNLVASWDGELYFIYLPTKERYSKDIVSHKTFQRRNEIMDLVKTLNIPLIDMHSTVFSKQPEPLSLFPSFGPHYNPKGYRLVAQAVIKSVGENRQDH